MIKKILVLGAVAALAGCSTSTYVKLPENTVMKIERGEQLPNSEGLVDRTPFSWSAAGGIPYRIEQPDGKVVSKGRMSAVFRPASIFWPPAAAIYWPMGFRFECNDLSGDKPKECSPEVREALKAKK